MAMPPCRSAAVLGDSAVTYHLGDLLEIAGEWLSEELTPRTVRLYATEGLIDRPGKAGRQAIYGQRHLLQLLLIRALAKRGLSHAAIAPLVASGNDELALQLQRLVQPAATPDQQSAIAYLQNLGGAGSLPGSQVSTASLLPLLGSPPSSGFASPSAQPSLSTRSAGRSSATSSRWHRFSLAPGVELHLSESASVPPPGERREAWLTRLLERLREQISNEG